MDNHSSRTPSRPSRRSSMSEEWERNEHPLSHPDLFERSDENPIVKLLRLLLVSR